MTRDDELAQTATSADSARPVPSETLESGTQLGRYTIERMLGAGGMGVVYAAFDSELERKIALKVLRPGLAAEAEQRLLREARAMARLASPNVVAVYDVGTTDGRDYIAMELIDGDNLVEWRAEAKPDRGTVLTTFIAAGHGLAAAHEAGLIHRDFKPHNVLRSKRGRVVVTDFGLARDSGTTEPAPRTTPVPIDLTAPGSLLGTPAYMAPEQWTGGEITPASDQFSFCIALWEGLTGERPFRGATVDELRASVLRGVDPAALAELPRRVRAVVRRGLAVDPARRWPSMVALLARLEHRRRKIAAGAIGVLAIAAAIVVIAHRDEPVATCEPPVLAPAAVWGLSQQLQIRAGSADAAKTLGNAFDHWQVARAGVCAERSATRAAKLDCLDRVLLRIDAIRRSRLYDLGASQWGVIAQLYDPEVCALADPPRMPNQYSEAAVIGLAQRGGVKLDPAALGKARAGAEHDACAQAYLAFIDGAADLAKSAAQLCGDDQAYGAAALNAIAQHGRIPSRDETTSIREAERAVKHAAQPFLLRQYYLFRARHAHDRDDLDAAIAFVDRAAGGDPVEFELERRMLRAGMLLQRARADDLAAVSGEVEALRRMWLPAYGPTVGLDAIAATAQWWQGEVERADATLVRVNHELVVEAGNAHPADPPVHGIVVDDRGHGVSNVTVTTGSGFVGDSFTPAVPLYEMNGWPRWFQTVQTDADGTFAFAHVPRDALVIAQQGGQRSRPAPFAETVRLVLAPTTAIRGHLRGTLERGHRYVSVPLGAYGVTAPIRSDGSFELAGIPLGPIELHALQVEGDHITRGPRRQIDSTRVQEVELDAPSTRTLDVVVRSATMSAIHLAEVTVLAGTHAATTVGGLRPHLAMSENTTETARIPDDAPPRTVAKLVAPGDVVAHVRGVPAGTVTVCAQGLNLENADAQFFQRYAASETSQPIRCEKVDEAATHVLIKVPPMNRVD